MKSVKVLEVSQNIGFYPILYLRNLSNPSFKQAYKPICIIPDGKDKGKLLIARWLNCAQRVLSFDDTLFIQ